MLSNKIFGSHTHSLIFRGLYIEETIRISKFSVRHLRQKQNKIEELKSYSAKAYIHYHVPLVLTNRAFSSFSAQINTMEKTQPLQVLFFISILCLVVNEGL